jgi:hypothetical protein
VEFEIRPTVVVEKWLRARFGGRRRTMRFKSRSDEPDLQSQLESLFDQVWRSESDWRLWDRVDQAVMLEDLRTRRAEQREIDRAA